MNNSPFCEEGQEFLELPPQKMDVDGGGRSISVGIIEMVSCFSGVIPSSLARLLFPSKAEKFIYFPASPLEVAEKALQKLGT